MVFFNFKCQSKQVHRFGRLGYIIAPRKFLKGIPSVFRDTDIYPVFCCCHRMLVYQKCITCVKHSILEKVSHDKTTYSLLLFWANADEKAMSIFSKVKKVVGDFLKPAGR